MLPDDELMASILLDAWPMAFDHGIPGDPTDSIVSDSIVSDLMSGLDFLLTPAPTRISIPLTAMQKVLQYDPKDDPRRVRRVSPCRISSGGGWVCQLIFLALLLLAAGLPSALAASHHHHPSKQVSQTIAHLERKWLAAQLNANISVMTNMLAEDYLGITPNGTLESKAETLANYKNGVVHFTTMSTSERKIRVYGSTAVVTSQAEVVGTHQADSIHGRYRYTRVYHNDGGSWKIISFEASKIRDGKKSSQKIPGKS